MNFLSQFFRRSYFWIREFGWLEYFFWLRVRSLGERRPTLDVFKIEALEAVSTAIDALRKLGMDCDQAPLDTWISEYRVMEQRMHSDNPTKYPSDYDLGKETSLLLYLLVRMSRPKNVVETGVARGQSSSVILGALEANGHGRLVSLDPDPSSGVLVPSWLRERWEKPSFSGRSARTVFKMVMNESAPLDIFLHDSNHRYGWMKFELALARKSLSSQGMLIADDIQQNLAFFDASSGAAQTVLLADGRKMCGLATFDSS